MLRAAGATVTGPAHVQTCQLNQDALSLRGWRGGWIAAVADGLGSKPFSRAGSALAVQRGQAEVRRRPSTAFDPRETATRLYRSWLTALPMSDPTQAATTLLLASCDAHGAVHTWQIGDGLVVARVAGRVKVLTPARAGFSNQTHALGMDRKWSVWSTHTLQLTAPGDMVVLMTDGVADDLRLDALGGFLTTVHGELAWRSRRRGRRWIAHELNHWSTPGHVDDKTLAVIFRD